MVEENRKMSSTIIKYTKLGCLVLFFLAAGWGIFYLSQNPILLKQESAFVELHHKYDPKEAISYVFFGKPKNVEIHTNVDTEKVGMYKTTYTYHDFTIEVNVEVRDTNPPILEVKDYTASIHEEVQVESFIKKIEDETEVVAEIDYMEKKKENEYLVTIKAKDQSGNVTKKKATLWRTEKAKK
ncbi:MAG: hypothetical protein Q4C49_04505 [Bacillota bacterium]|nr:hypothetical protein [Bacillota bacterium]